MLGLRIGLLLGEQGGASGPVYEAEAAALFARMTTPPDDARKTHINQLIKDLKAAALWTKFDILCVTAAHNAQAARLNWAADRYNLTPSGSPTFREDHGYSGNGSSALLAPEFNPTTAVRPKYALNSATLFCWKNSDSSGGTSYGDCGGWSAAAVAVLRSRAAADVGVARINQATGYTFPTPYPSIGSFAATRTGANAGATYVNGTLVSSDATASSAVPDESINLLGAFAQSSIFEYAAFAVMSGINGVDAAALHVAVAKYMTSIGN